MENLKQLEIIPEKSRAIVEEGLSAILKRRRLGGYNLDYIQIENFLSGGKTGAIVFAASFGLKEKSLEGKYYRVLKIALGNICRNEKAGADLNEKLQLDTFSNLTYSSEDDFLFENPKTGEKENYGVLLYQDIGIASENKLQNFYSALSEAMNNPNMGKAKRLCLNLSSQLQKEIFSGLKRSLYKLLKEEKVNLSEYYGDKFSRKVLEGITELQKIDSTIPDPKYLKSIFDETSIYHSVSYIHGDLHPENLLIWKLDDLSYRSKLIDFGEVIPKRMERFTPLFWDFSRLLGEVILNFIEDELNLSKPHDKNIDFLKSIDGSLNRLWFIFDSIFSGDFNKLENVDFKFQLLGNIYFNTLFSFLYESKSGITNLLTPKVFKDYIYCQILFFIFFSKFNNENSYKRIFGIKLALKLQNLIQKEEEDIISYLNNLEKYYFKSNSEKINNKNQLDGPPSNVPCPFKGLAYFTEKDKDFFYGREKVINEILEEKDNKSIIALVGSSGSGKSSLVYAGVIPKLREDNYLILSFRPNEDPIEALLNSFFANTSYKKEIQNSNLDLLDMMYDFLCSNPKEKIFILGDQFEEIFTLTKSENKRRELGNLVIELARIFPDRFIFLFTIRADFWVKLLEQAPFSKIIGESELDSELVKKIFLTPMKDDELRSAIINPIKFLNGELEDNKIIRRKEEVKFEFEGELVDFIINSIIDQPGSLPLLQFCLLEIWKYQTNYTITYEAYNDIGKVRGAIANYAERVYNSLDSSEKKALKKIMLQLVQPGQGTEDTRRIALLTEILPDLENQTDPLQNKTWMNNLISKLINLRIITSNTNASGIQTLEVVHEALIREWKRFKEWMEEDREFRIWQEKLRGFLIDWEKSKKNEVNLLNKSNLVIAEEFYKKRPRDLSRKEIEFIELSTEKLKNKKIKFWSLSILISLSYILTFGLFGILNYHKAEDINDELQLKIKDIEFSEKKLEESIKENSPYLSKIAQGFGLNVNQLLNSSNPIRWSKNLGKMNWIDADKACQKLGNNWRLPKKGEWLFNYFTNIKKMKEWEKESDILIHWTISNNSSYSAINNSFQTNNGKKAYGFNISNGDYSFEKIDLKFSTRCIRD